MVMTCIKALTEVKVKVKDDVFSELTGMLSERKKIFFYMKVFHWMKGPTICQKVLTERILFSVL